ncbi:MAG: hypothetical protein HYY37_02200 [Candidatus Aenigmarchaeota archaeon]|nr:hypothetical protein [Candidatus Aenigmarchaeota archaeon]
MRLRISHDSVAYLQGNLYDPNAWVYELDGSERHLRRVTTLREFYEERGIPSGYFSLSRRRVAASGWWSL